MLIFPVSHCRGLAFSALVVTYFLFCWRSDWFHSFVVLFCFFPFPSVAMIIIVKHLNNHLMVAGSASGRQTGDNMASGFRWLFPSSPVALSADERVLCLSHTALGWLQDLQCKQVIYGSTGFTKQSVRGEILRRGKVPGSSMQCADTRWSQRGALHTLFFSFGNTTFVTLLLLFLCACICIFTKLRVC